jgi:hypothetical protein
MSGAYINAGHVDSSGRGYHNDLLLWQAQPRAWDSIQKTMVAVLDK